MQRTNLLNIIFAELMLFWFALILIYLVNLNLFVFTLTLIYAFFLTMFISIESYVAHAPQSVN